ncbi:hypothetical protein [Muricoccus radiodurans]|uniref:hypothetical protein n=1 Tax=Muricoccus radiodurans TaxID=2231721 RepID=UPI003CF5FDE7
MRRRFPIGGRSIRQGAVLVLLAAGSVAAPRAAELPRPVPLRVVAEGFLPQRSWQEPVCRLAEAPCGGARTPPSLLRAANAAVGTYHAILPGPVLAELRFSRGQWQLRRRWDFRGHPLALGREEDAATRLFPALYPAGPDRWAVAFQRVRNEGYAGGGASFSRADFLLLPAEGGAVGADATLFPEVPFSCSKMVRACFSERDHRTSRHCHDESTGSLSIRVVPGPDPAWHDWVLTWQAEDWPSGVGRSGVRTTSATARLRHGDDAAAVAARTGSFDFCGGSQE